MKKIAICLVTITLLLLSGCEKGFDYRNKWEGNYEFVHEPGHEIGRLWIEKNGEHDLQIVIPNISTERFIVTVDKKGHLHGDSYATIEGKFIKKDSLVFSKNYIAQLDHVKKPFIAKKTRKPKKKSFRVYS